VVLAAYQSDASEVRGLGGALEPSQYQPLLLSYGTACLLLAGAQRLRRSIRPAAPHEALNGPQRSETTHGLSQGSALC
jgi:hypothetical protein